MTNQGEINITTNNRLLHDGFEVMKLVYEHYDPQNAPVKFDRTKYKVHLTYETSRWDPSTPVKATLLLKEAWEMGIRIHFYIDLLYPCICDKFTRKQHRTPPDVWSLLGGFKSYMNDTLSARRTSRMKGYYSQLVKKNLLSRDEFRSYQRKEPGLEWGGTCPLCFDYANGTGSELIACVSCSKLGCAKSGCHGHDIDGIVQSVNNPGETYCKLCNGRNGNSRLVSCTKCHVRWFNPYRHPRCIGRPGPSIIINLPSRTGGRTWPSLKKTFLVPSPQHPTLIAPCGECWEDGNSEWLTCGNLTCWSLGGIVCNNCSPSGGVKCVGGHTWFCDECANQLPSLKCCYNPEKSKEEQIVRDIGTIFGPRDFPPLVRGLDDLSKLEQLQIFS